MTLRNVALQYGEFLLARIRVAGLMKQWAVADDLCDRFERLMANLLPVPQPLVWEGDYA